MIVDIDEHGYAKAGNIRNKITPKDDAEVEISIGFAVIA
jgi:hypothetical protein